MKYNEAERKALSSDGRYQDIGNLPSNFIPYSFKSLHVRPFTVHELRLISKAAVLKEYVHLLRAIDLVITEDVNEISIGDFYYLLMWLRIHSMPKTPYVIEWHCEANVLVDKTSRKRLFYDDPEYATLSLAETLEPIPCETHNSEIVHLSDVEIISLEDAYEALPDTQVKDVEFDFPRVHDLVAIQTAMENPELRLIVGAAQWIKAKDLDAKIKVLEDQPDLDLFDRAGILNEQVIHGIRETVTLSCRGCGVKRPHTLALDALTFFR